ncbi:DUF2442 domain-containing protein [Sulfuriferula sp.]|uniref:DUF2442 domain-containing protein n=1 Tax=Sulfuriferula sp. TaxID=2025307 RepID=UPI00272F3D05|nr:DUF2442 domain-containing protein [Sulfuriferula sp.]MDP2024588.1 DUF2442 domain-containing protein [Sulfuriferula sp.]
MLGQTASEADQTTGVIPAAPWRIKALSVLPDYRLAVTFMDNTNGIVDFSAVPTAKECGIFEALKDKACFDQARLELGVVTWPDGADMDPGWMYEQIRVNKSWSVPF